MKTVIPTTVLRLSAPCLQHQHRRALAPPSTETSDDEQTDPMNDIQTIN